MLTRLTWISELSRSGGSAVSDQGFTMTERQARLDRDLAEAESFRAQAERDRWQAEYNRHSAAQQEASTQDTLSSAAFRGAADVEHRTYHLIGEINEASAHACAEFLSRWARQSPVTDRKSTRLNSSHVSISYAVFCLKNKKLHLMWCVLEGDKNNILVVTVMLWYV